jgi:23S rRNA pseudouridine2604 synthase
MNFLYNMDTSLNKYISETGFCSRREADNYIDQGRVSINGNVAIKGNRVADGDVVHVDGEPLKKKRNNAVYIVLNKPKGVTCTTDQKDKTNIIDFVNFKTRIFPIGRLDKRSEGLIFLTNDGDIVNKILRAGNNHEKEYIVSVDKPIDTDFINRMRNGVRILNTVTQKCFVKQEGTKRFRIILTQGLNRQIRRMCEALGYEVEALQRIRIMNMNLTGLKSGHWRYFTPAEIDTINAMVANSSKTASVDGMDE